LLRYTVATPRLLSSLRLCPLSSSAAAPPHPLPSFPTRRSSDLNAAPPRRARRDRAARRRASGRTPFLRSARAAPRAIAARSTCPDRKSTRLNSSHVSISYAVFCLKKKKTDEKAEIRDTRRGGEG